MARRTTIGPSLFTAVQITNKELKQSLRKVKKKAIDDNYYAKNYIVPLEEAHVHTVVATMTFTGVKPSISTSNVAQNANQGTVLKFACSEDFKTPPTCSNRLSFD